MLFIVGYNKTKPLCTESTHVCFTNKIRFNNYQIWLEVRSWKSEAALLLASDFRLRTTKFVETESLALKCIVLTNNRDQ